MSSSPDAWSGTAVLRGSDAARATSARFDTELRSHRYLKVGHDPRLLDPSLEQAFVEATAEARAMATAQGYTAGYAAGRTAASEEVAAEAAQAAAIAAAAARSRMELLDRSVTALSTAATSLARTSTPTYEDVADHLGPIAVQIVEALLGRELVLAPLQVLDAVRRAVTSAPAEATLSLHLNPQDAATLNETHPDLEAELGRPVRVVADPSVNTGGAVAVHDAARVEVCLANAFARVRAELSP